MATSSLTRDICDARPVRGDEIDELHLVRHLRTMRSLARPELDNDILAKAVFHQRGNLLGHVRYVFLPLDVSAGPTTFLLRTISHKVVCMTKFASRYGEADNPADEFEIVHVLRVHTCM